MATPALDRLRAALPGAFIGALVRPGLDQLLAGLDALDEFHLIRPQGMMRLKHAASKVRPRRYDAALLLTNSFSTALVTRLAGVPRRIGYDRDGRGVLLTDRLVAPKHPDGSWAPIPAVSYYWHAVAPLADTDFQPGSTPGTALPPGATLRLACSDAQRDAGETLLARARLHNAPFALLNPGASKPEKRWPAERFAALAKHLHNKHGLAVALTGSPAEAELLAAIAGLADVPVVNLSAHGLTLGSLKHAVQHARLLVTNDTGPRHIAAALGTPLVSLFGPTDPRWARIPTSAPEVQVLADPDLPADALANDHPERCRMDRIDLERVAQAASDALSSSTNQRTPG